MAYGFEGSIDEVVEEIIDMHEGNRQRAFLLLSDPQIAKEVSNDVAQNLDLGSVHEVALSMFTGNDTKIRVQQEIGRIIRSSEKGLLLLHSLESVSKETMLIVGSVCGDKIISDRSAVAEPIPDGWIFIVAGDENGNPTYLHNSWFLQRFSILIAKHVI